MISEMAVLFKKKIVISITSILIVSLAGCADLHNLVDLKKDSLGKNFSSIVIMKLKLTDKSGTTCHRDVDTEYGIVSNYFTTIVSGQENAGKWDWIHKALNLKWSVKNGICYHEGLYVGQAKPSKCRLRLVHIYVSDLTGSYGLNPRVDDKPHNFTVGPDEIVYLGTLDLVIDGIQTDSSGKKVNMVYSYTLGVDPGERSADIETFKKAYPKLFERFKGNVKDVVWE